MTTEQNKKGFSPADPIYGLPQDGNGNVELRKVQDALKAFGHECPNCGDFHIAADDRHSVLGPEMCDWTAYDVCELFMPILGLDTTITVMSYAYAQEVGEPRARCHF